jgi:hypothetical protein
MTTITASMVAELRGKTDAPMMECKKALTEAEGDMVRAEEILRVKLGSKAGKAAARVTAEGVIVLGTSADASAMLEVNCETDFVTKNDSFLALANAAAALVAQAPGACPVGAEFVVHDVELTPESWLAKATQSRHVQGASFHHQGIDRLAPGFQAVGFAPDGLLEAIEHEEHRIVGVQWHPEDTSADDAAQQGIYDTFVEGARRN